LPGLARVSWDKFRRCPPFRSSFDSHARFPRFCTASGKWFRRRRDCFVLSMPTKQFLIISNSFSWFIGPARTATIDAERIFNPDLVDKLWTRPARVEPKASRGPPNRTTCNFSRQLDVVQLPFNKGWQSWTVTTSLLVASPHLLNPLQRLLSNHPARQRSAGRCRNNAAT